MNNENTEALLGEDTPDVQTEELVSESFDAEDRQFGDDVPDTDAEGAPEFTEEDETATDRSENADRIEELCLRQSIDAEYLEFARLFPGVNIASLPDSVCDGVRRGVPLAAAYALYEKQRSVESSMANEKNTKNASLSFRLKENGAEKYFSPDEVKSMSREEVRTNYKRIIESMRHWR